MLAANPVAVDYARVMKSGLECATCQGRLAGRQRKFCSRVCKNVDTNHRHQNYAKQQERGRLRKIALLNEAGACCSRCGYRRNLAALAWHHVDPSRKEFSIDLRALSNRSLDEIHREAEKCVILCANCHAELHHPRFDACLPGGIATRPRMVR